MSPTIITYRQAVDAHQILVNLPVAAIDDATLCDLEDNIIALRPHVEAVKQKRNRLARKYAERDEDGSVKIKQRGQSQNVEIDDERREEYEAAISDLLSQEVEVTDLKLVSREQIKPLGLRLGRQAALRCIME